MPKSNQISVNARGKKKGFKFYVNLGQWEKTFHIQLKNMEDLKDMDYAPNSLYRI